MYSRRVENFPKKTLPSSVIVSVQGTGVVVLEIGSIVRTIGSVVLRGITLASFESISKSKTNQLRSINVCVY